MNRIDFDYEGCERSYLTMSLYNLSNFPIPTSALISYGFFEFRAFQEFTFFFSALNYFHVVEIKYFVFSM